MARHTEPREKIEAVVPHAVANRHGQRPREPGKAQLTLVWVHQVPDHHERGGHYNKLVQLGNHGLGPTSQHRFDEEPAHSDVQVEHRFLRQPVRTRAVPDGLLVDLGQCVAVAGAAAVLVVARQAEPVQAVETFADLGSDRAAKHIRRGDHEVDDGAPGLVGHVETRVGHVVDQATFPNTGRSDPGGAVGETADGGQETDAEDPDGRVGVVVALDQVSDEGVGVEGRRQVTKDVLVGSVEGEEGEGQFVRVQVRRPVRLRQSGANKVVDRLVIRNR